MKSYEMTLFVWLFQNVPLAMLWCLPWWSLWWKSSRKTWWLPRSRSWHWQPLHCVAFCVVFGVLVTVVAVVVLQKVRNLKIVIGIKPNTAGKLWSVCDRHHVPLNKSRKQRARNVKKCQESHLSFQLRAVLKCEPFGLCLGQWQDGISR